MCQLSTLLNQAFSLIQALHFSRLSQNNIQDFISIHFTAANVFLCLNPFYFVLLFNYNFSITYCGNLTELVMVFIFIVKISQAETITISFLTNYLSNHAYLIKGTLVSLYFCTCYDSYEIKHVYNGTVSMCDLFKTIKKDIYKDEV